MSDPREQIICMATDAMRACMGLPARNYSRRDVIDYLERLEAKGCDL